MTTAITEEQQGFGIGCQYNPTNFDAEKRYG